VSITKSGLQDFSYERKVSVNIDLPSANGDSASRLAIPLCPGDIYLPRAIDPLDKLGIDRFILSSEDHDDVGDLGGLCFLETILSGDRLTARQQFEMITGLDKLGDASS
jgi:hypothetical protein